MSRRRDDGADTWDEVTEAHAPRESRGAYGAADGEQSDARTRPHPARGGLTGARTIAGVGPQAAALSQRRPAGGASGGADAVTAPVGEPASRPADPLATTVPTHAEAELEAHDQGLPTIPFRPREEEPRRVHSNAVTLPPEGMPDVSTGLPTLESPMSSVDSEELPTAADEKPSSFDSPGAPRSARHADRHPGPPRAAVAGPQLPAARIAPGASAPHRSPVGLYVLWALALVALATAVMLFWLF